MSNSASSEAAKAVVRRNTEVQGKGNFDVFEELFADDFVDHTPQPTMIPDKHGARGAPAFPERSAGGNGTMTTQGLNMSNNVRQIPLGSGLRKVAATAAIGTSDWSAN